MKYLFITNDPELADYAFKSGVDRVMVDLETIGKSLRQMSRNTLISNHDLNDIIRIKEFNPMVPIICRINGFYGGSKNEVDIAIKNGAEFIMLPMFRTALEVNRIYEYIDSRAKLILLFETPQSIVRLDEIVGQKKFDEAHIGLNDLSLGLGIDFMFELFVSDIIEYIVNIFKINNIPFGIGGIAKIGEGVALSDLVLSEHVRLGSESVILSRSFHEYSRTLKDLLNCVNLKEEIDKLNNLKLKLMSSDESILLKNKEILKFSINNYLSNSK